MELRGLKELIYTMIIGLFGIIVVVIDEVNNNIFNIADYGWTYFNIISHCFTYIFVVAVLYFLAIIVIHLDDLSTNK
jgi:hypothetical protein